jgi:glycosyltransferase involved in cell wall biosynthesis
VGVSDAGEVSSDNSDITVAVTNYNYGRYLPEAVASALAQAGGEPHVIVVDDGSTDPDTEDVLAGLPSQVKVVRQANAGPAAARNTAFRLASTPYLIVLDADDRLRPNALQVLKNLLEAEPALGFTYGLTHFFGDWEGEMTMPPYDPYKLLYRHMIGATALFRRALLDDVGGFDPEFAGYEDWEFWLHALAKGWRGRRVEQPTLDYRRHGPTGLGADRRQYHYWYRRLRQRHHALYDQHRELARQSEIRPLQRAVYRWWWGARPLPASLELKLHAILWRRR